MKRKMIAPPSGEPPTAGRAMTVSVSRRLALDVAKYLATHARLLKAGYFVPRTRKWDTPHDEQEHNQVRDWVKQLRKASL